MNSRLALIVMPLLMLAITNFFGCANNSQGEGREINLKEYESSYFGPTIFTGGTILTMNDNEPRVEAIAIDKGKIVAVGPKALVATKVPKETPVINLQGKVLLPGFIDGHSHFFQAAMVADYANVSAPPVGPAASIAKVVETLLQYKNDKKLGPEDWIIGYGYDKTSYSDGREAVKEDFDQAFPTNPMVLVHVSGHGAMLNSAAFKKLNITAHTQAPKGGIIERKKGSKEPAGLLMENAWFMMVMPKLPHASEEELLGKLESAQIEYAKNGYTTVQDSPTDPKAALPVFKRAQKEGRFFLDVVSYADPNAFAKQLQEEKSLFGNKYVNHFKVPGVKMLLDGSPQGRTAYFTKPYLPVPSDPKADNRGSSIVDQDKVNALMKLAYDNNLQVLAHANGDAAIEMIIKGHEAAGAKKDSRTVAIHAQFIRDDQLTRFAQHGLIPSLFTNHAYFWGDVHQENLGEERANFLSPMKSALSRGLRPTNHSDFLVTPLNTMFILWTSVARESRTGKIIGANERISPWEGLKALTINGAYQYFEEQDKGSLEAGKLADLVILSADPTAVPVNAIKDITVVETIKEGKRVFRTK